MNVSMNWLAGLALLILMYWLRGLFSVPQHRLEFQNAWRRGWRVIFRELWCLTDGVVAIVYTSPFINFGTSTAPTATQAAGLEVQTLTVYFADADAQAVLVHNWGSVQMFPPPVSWSAYLLPYISYWKLLGGGGAAEASFGTDFTWGITNTNSVTMNKTNVGSGSGGTWAVRLARV